MNGDQDKQRDHGQSGQHQQGAPAQRPGQDQQGGGTKNPGQHQQQNPTPRREDDDELTSDRKEK